MGITLGRPRTTIWSPVVETNAVQGLRRRRDKDLAACARLLRLVHYDSAYPLVLPSEPRAWLADDDQIGAWVVERQGEVLGHVAASRVGHDTVSRLRWREMTGRDPAEVAAVTRLFVRRRARRQGIGSTLVRAAADDIRTRGLVPVVQVTDCNRDAVRLFRGLGWRLLSMDQWGERGQRLRVHCYLAPPTAG